MEYTDAPTLEPPVSADTMECPLCGHILPKDADACDRCDWIRTETETAEGKASDAVAVMLSTAHAPLAIVAEDGCPVIVMSPVWSNLLGDPVPIVAVSMMLLVVFTLVLLTDSRA